MQNKVVLSVPVGSPRKEWRAPAIEDAALSSTEAKTATGHAETGIFTNYKTGS